MSALKEAVLRLAGRQVSVEELTVTVRRGECLHPLYSADLARKRGRQQLTHLSLGLPPAVLVTTPARFQDVLAVAPSRPQNTSGIVGKIGPVPRRLPVRPSSGNQLGVHGRTRIHRAYHPVLPSW